MEAILMYRRAHPDGHGPEVVDVVCPACSETRTLNYHGWTEVKCSGCGEDITRPDDGLPAVSPADAFAIKIRVICEGMETDHRVMTSPNGNEPDGYASRLDVWVRLLSDAIARYDDSQPKPF